MGRQRLILCRSIGLSDFRDYQQTKTPFPTKGAHHESDYLRYIEARALE